MKKLLFLFLFLPQISKANALNDHDDLVHDLSHYAAGTIIAETLHMVDGSLKPWQKAVTETVFSCAGNFLYEKMTEKTNETTIERTVSGTLGGLVFSLEVNILKF